MLHEVKIPNGSVSFQKHGKGSPLILLGGYGSSLYNWPKELITELAKTFTLYLYNYRGVGYSKANNYEYSICSLAEDLHQFINALELKTISLFGFSMGGFVAQEFVIKFNAKINYLILCSTKICGQKSVQTPKEIIEKMSSKNESKEEEIETDLKLNFPISEIDKFRESQKERYNVRQQPEYLVTPEIRAKQREAITQWNKNFRSDDYQKYSQIYTNKTIILNGLKDIITPSENASVLNRHLKNSTMHIFENGGHGLLRQFPYEIAKIITT
jgi:pimeloyl-ACP methyl ester carboxylesterase